MPDCFIAHFGEKYNRYPPIFPGGEPVPGLFSFRLDPVPELRERASAVYLVCALADRFRIPAFRALRLRELAEGLFDRIFPPEN